MPILIALSVVIQAIFIVHALRTGRPYWWAFIILSFPVIGCLAYYLVEIFPGSSEHRAMRRAVANLKASLSPGADLARRAEEAQVCDSVDNKAALAAECMRNSMYADAVSLYEGCLQGIYADDPVLSFALSEAYVMNGQCDSAAARLQRLQELHPQFRPTEVRLLLARNLEARGDYDSALLAYEKINETTSGLEARVRYGLLLRRLGFTRQANGVLREALKYARRFGGTLESERAWVDVAKSNLVAD